MLLSVCHFRVFRLFVDLFRLSGCLSFLPQSNDKQIRLIGYFKLPIDVNVSVIVHHSVPPAIDGKCF